MTETTSPTSSLAGPVRRRRIRRSAFVALSATTLFTAALPSVASADPLNPVTFSYTGTTQSWTVPDGVCAVTADVYGAQGGPGDAFLATGVTSSGEPHGYIAVPSAGGLGAYATSTITVTPGENLVVAVGGAGDGGQTPDGTIIGDSSQATNIHGSGVGGWNGGADGGTVAADDVHAGGGGGASDVRRGGDSLADRVVVAGGGGGSGAGSPFGGLQKDGSGGVSGEAGHDGTAFTIDLFSAHPTATPVGVGAGGGRGGTQTSGGVGGAGAVPDPGGPSATSGSSGAAGVGGIGAANGLGTYGAAGGGGGGGLFGGGGGGAASSPTTNNPDVPPGSVLRIVAGGGGGGSSLGGTVTQGVREGNGKVTLTPVAGDCHAPTTPSTTPSQVSPANAVAAKPTYTG